MVFGFYCAMADDIVVATDVGETSIHARGGAGDDIADYSPRTKAVRVDFDGRADDGGDVRTGRGRQDSIFGAGGKRSTDFGRRDRSRAAERVVMTSSLAAAGGTPS